MCICGLELLVVTPDKCTNASEKRPCLFCYKGSCSQHLLMRVFLACRDADETKEWIEEKNQALNTDNYGHDLASVQALQRKHEGFERDLAALGDKVGAHTALRRCRECPGQSALISRFLAASFL